MKTLVCLSLLLLAPALHAAPFAEGVTVVASGKTASVRSRLPRTFFVAQIADLTRQIEKTPQNALLYARRARAWSRAPDVTTANGEIVVGYWPQVKSDLARARELAPRDVAVLVACLEAVHSATQRATGDVFRLTPPTSYKTEASVPALETAQTAVRELEALKIALEKEGKASGSQEFVRWKMGNLLDKLSRTSIVGMQDVADEIKATAALAPDDATVAIFAVTAERFIAAYNDIFKRGDAARIKAQTDPILELQIREQPQIAHDAMSRAARFLTRTVPDLALEWQTRAAQIGGVTQSADNKLVAWKLDKARQDNDLEAFLYDLDPFFETETRSFELPELARRLALEKVRLGQFEPARRAFETAANWGGKSGLWMEAGDMAYRSDDFRAAGDFYETFMLLKGDAVGNRWLGGRIGAMELVYPLRLEVGLVNALAGATPAQRTQYLEAMTRYDIEVLRLHRKILEFNARRFPANATLQSALKSLDARLQSAPVAANLFRVTMLKGTDFNADAPFRPSSPANRYLLLPTIKVSENNPIFNNKGIANEQDRLLTSSIEIINGKRPALGVRSVQNVWSVDLKAGEKKPQLDNKGKFWLLVPSFWALEIKRLDAVIKNNPDDTNALAQRAAAWSMAYGSDMRWGEAQRLEAGGLRNKGNVEADVAEVLKRPLDVATLNALTLARRARKYAPSPMDVMLKDGAEIRAVGEELQLLDGTFAQFEKVAPLVTIQRAYLFGKSTIAALAPDEKNAGALQRAEKFLGIARSFIAKDGDKSPMNLWIIAVESARGTLAGDLGAQIRSAGAKMGDAELASESQAELARMLWSVGKIRDARAWSEAALETAGATPSPLVRWMKVRTADKISDADLPALRESAMDLSFLDRDKVAALLLLARESQKRGQLGLQLRALEQALTYGAPPQTWVEYSRVALQARQWGNAFNANRLAVAWQNDEGRAKNSMAELMGDATDAQPHLQTALRLEGAFMMIKLGKPKMANDEIKDTLEKAIETAKKSGADEFLAALEAHSRLLETELETTPEDEDLKKAIDKLADARQQMMAK